MMNFVQAGDSLTFTAPADLASGQGFLLGSLFLVSTTTVKSGATGVAMVRGVHRLPKATGALTQFQKVYWDDTAKNVTGTASGNRLIGAATYPQASGDLTVEVRLNANAV